MCPLCLSAVDVEVVVVTDRVVQAAKSKVRPVVTVVAFSPFISTYEHIMTVLTSKAKQVKVPATSRVATAL